MERCLVCSHDFVQDGTRCPRCQWPIGFGSITRNPRTDADVVNWAAMMYKKLLKMYEQQQAPTNTSKNPQPTAAPAELSALDARVQQLTAELHNFNSAYIQERHRCNRKIDELTKEIEFFKEVIQTNQESAKKIANLENQYQEIIQRIDLRNSSPIAPILPLVLIGDKQPTSYDASTAITSSANEAVAQLETVLAQPTVFPVFETIPEQLPTLEVKTPISPAERDLLDAYNRSKSIPESIRKDALDVSIDPDALNRLRDGDASQIILVADRKGNFLVVRRGSYQYLVPNKKRQINSHILKTVKSIYTCEGYYEEYQQFTLVRPALVEEITSDRWQLGQKGALKFK